MTKARDDLSVQQVRDALSYDPLTGILTWRNRTDRLVQWNGKFAGRAAGSLSDRGYVVVAISGRDYRAHRLAWAIVTGHWPHSEVDHKNLNRSDNRWENLRESSHSQNGQNKPAQANNTSGYKGVSFCKITKTWVARMMVDGRYVVLGRSQTPEAAHKLYKKSAEQHCGAFSNHSTRR